MYHSHSAPITEMPPHTARIACIVSIVPISLFLPVVYRYLLTAVPCVPVMSIFDAHHMAVYPEHIRPCWMVSAKIIYRVNMLSVVVYDIPAESVLAQIRAPDSISTWHVRQRKIHTRTNLHKLYPNLALKPCTMRAQCNPLLFAISRGLDCNIQIGSFSAYLFAPLFAAFCCGYPNPANAFRSYCGCNPCSSQYWL